MSFFVFVGHPPLGGRVVALTSVPDATAKTGNASANVVYTFTLTNTGSESDTFTITKSGDVWTTVINDTEHTLAAGANTTFTVTVTVPQTANDAATDAITITATSGNDTSVTDVDNLTTTAVAVPKVVGTPVLWLDASQLTGLSNNDPVTTWTDLSASANNASQATAANKPLYKTSILNGLAAVRFDGSNDSMATAASLFTGAGNRTIAVVYVDTNAGNPHTSSLCGQAAGATISSWFLLQGRTQAGATGEPYFAGFANDLEGNAQDQTAHYAVCTYDGATLTVRSNGAQTGTGSKTLNTVDDEFLLGHSRASDPTEGEFLTGDLYEVIVYLSVLSGANITTLESYLAAKWGL